MIKKETLHNVLKNFGFKESNSIWSKQYNNGASITVDFIKQSIEYAPIDDTFKNGEYPTSNKPAKGFIKHRDTILNFNANENFVCLVCIHLLLEKGYEPKHIVFEPAFKVGHVNKQSYGDILVFDKNYKPLVLIENKTFGSEFSAEWNNMQKNGGQLFSYLGPIDNQIGLCNYLVLFACDFDEQLVLKSHIITLKDNDKRIAELENPLTFKNRDPSFEVWDKTYAKSFETKGLFEDDIEPYSIGKTKYTIKDLKSLSHAEIRPIYHEFATILRNHAITDFEHSFYILIDLFLCKIADERNNPNDLQFYYKGVSRDTPKQFCSRLLKLYKQGKKDLFGVDVVNKEESDIQQIFDDTARSLTNGLFASIKELFEEIKFYNIKKFNFIDVENKEEFELNFQILIKITALIQDINLSNSETNHFFGDLFEGLLSKNVHQTEGQFFTPLPIVNFIIKSLPQFDNSKNVKVLDYACGAGHFLTEFIKAYPNTEVYGIEKSQPLSQVAKIATIINGANTNSHIVFKDALSFLNNREIRFQGFDEESFDCIIANPPYSVKGFLNTLTKNERDKFTLCNYVNEKTLDSKRSIECFFIERSKYFLKQRGIMGIVLPSSILSNGEIYIKTRELLFESFNILSIVSLGSRTFGSTGTNTIILFAQKVKKNSHGLLETFISKKDYTQYVNHKALDDYLVKQNYDKQDYFEFMQDDNLSKKLEDHEIFANYKQNFKKVPIKKTLQKELFKISSYYKNELKENSKEYKKLLNEFLSSNEYKMLEQAEYRKQFISFVKEIEKDKLNTFIQIQSNEVAILQSPPDKIKNKSNKTEIVKFLGYDWSNRKGSEGIKYIVDQLSDTDDISKEEVDAEDAEIIESINSIKYIKTPLYNPNDDYDHTKYAFALRKHNCEQCKKFSFNFQPSNKLNNLFENNEDTYLHYAKLTEMIDFSKTIFNKAIKLNVINEQIESRFPLVRLKEHCDIIRGVTFDKKSQRHERTKNVVLTSDNITLDGHFFLKKEIFIANEISFEEDKKLKKNDLFMCFSSGSKSHVGKLALIPHDTDYYAGGFMGIIRTDNNILPAFLYEVLNYDLTRKIISNSANVTNINNLSNSIGEIKIPFPPIEIQQSIVSECEQIDLEYTSAQKNIEEAKKHITEIIDNVQDNLVKLENTAAYATNKIPYKNIDPTSYISTDNLLQNCEGTRLYEGIPNINNVVSYEKDDILVSNIRPYLKKAWLADKDGGCSPDVLVFRVLDKNFILPKYLFALLCQDKFFDFMMEGVQGVKMPRGNTSLISNFLLPVPSLEKQKAIIIKIDKLESEIADAKNILATASDRKKAVLEKYLC